MKRRSRVGQTSDFKPGAGLEIAMLGDSTVRDFSIASDFEMIRRMWWGNARNPFLDTDPSSGITSVFERMARLAPTRAVEYACSGAGVGPARTRTLRWFQRLANVLRFDQQIDRLLAGGDLPHLTLIWIGHNNLDFVTELRRFSRELDLDRACDSLVRAFEDRFRADLVRVLDRAREQSRPCAIVVYGLVNPRATRVARERARLLAASSPGLYPYLAKTEKRFPSLRPEHSDRLERLSDRLTRVLQEAAQDLDRQCRAQESAVRVYYSATTTDLDFSHPDLLSVFDAWHASVEGKAMIAQALYEGLQQALEDVSIRLAKNG